MERSGLGRNTPLTTSEFIERAQQKYGDRFDYSESVCVSILKPIRVICRTHGPYEIKAKIILQADMVASNAVKQRD